MNADFPPKYHSTIHFSLSITVITWQNGPGAVHTGCSTDNLKHTVHKLTTQWGPLPIQDCVCNSAKPTESEARPATLNLCPWKVKQDLPLWICAHSWGFSLSRFLCVFLACNRGEFSSGRHSIEMLEQKGIEIGRLVNYNLDSLHNTVMVERRICIDTKPLTNANLKQTQNYQKQTFSINYQFI